ncbi:MAG: acetyl-CoA carboxylase, biotin carboxyl carrier protein [Lachnospiraceae bacterium]|nr:acetyl-CoA carboxylase, biotin carboxyl carrier protein [Lachnospiraceae bacterium]
MNDGANTNVTGNADSITSSGDNNGLVIEKTIVQESASNNVVNNQTVVESTSNMVPVKAPLIGIYYAKPSPSAEAFVKVGDYVNKGDVLCIIEAMKMFNEIKAEVSGRIEEICVNNGNVVEYGQTLFNIIP